MESRHVNILNIVKLELMSKAFKKSSITSERAFSRDRVWSLVRVVSAHLNLVSKSMSIEISKFLGLSLSTIGLSSSKQAFSKARAKVKWEGYERLNNVFVSSFYKNPPFHTFKGYCVLGVDGTKYQLPSTADTIKHFGVGPGGHTTAKGVKIYDCMNKVSLACSIGAGSFSKGEHVSEESLFDECLEKLPGILEGSGIKPLLVGDRLYPSFYYLAALPDKGYDYLFRCHKAFCAEVIDFAEAGLSDEILSIDLSRGTRPRMSSVLRIEGGPRVLAVRCTRVTLDGGEDEFLLSSLPDEGISTKDLKALYWMRWEEETSFNRDKNMMEVEDMSSKSANGILQEIYAGLLASNIGELVIKEAQVKLDKEMEGKNNKYSYKINRSIAIGLMKDQVPIFIAGDKPLEDWFDSLVLQVLRHRQPVRPGRKFPRKRKNLAKYSMNMRKSI